MPRIELSLHVSAPQERCFDLARSIEAHTHSTSATGERAVGGKTTGLLSLGDSVTWQARPLGVWQRLTSRITAYQRPEHFRDSMESGAFAYFHHDHFFVRTTSGTLMRDVFEYLAPFGVVGRVAERVFLTAYMKRFLQRRMYELKDVAESNEWSRFVPPGT